jgi:hypothetical protein
MRAPKEREQRILSALIGGMRLEIDYGNKEKIVP